MSNEQTSTCTEAATRNAQPRLSGRDREIALQAIVARATGTPVQAAYQILAGIEALDTGPEAPLVMLWPKGDGYETLEDKAAWHVAERDRLLYAAGGLERARKLARQQKVISCSGAVPAGPDESEGLLGRPVSQECFARQQIQAGEPSAQGEADRAAPHLPGREPSQGASDE